MLLALVATASALAGVVVAALMMFISTHDLSVLGMVIITGGAVAVASALLLSGAYERSAAQLVGLARSLASSEPVSAPTRLATGELQRLAEELSQVSDQLAESRRRERALDSSRRELVAWVSHDLRSPIASVRAMSEALADGVVDDPASVARFHHAINTEAERLAGLVDDLFELSRITSGSLDPDPLRVPLTELVAEMVDVVAPAAAAKGVVLRAALDELPVVMVPAADLRRALHNLLDNAIRHTGSGGQVVLAGASVDDGVEVSVADECGGIPEADLPRLFDVAFRGDAARTRDHGGGGLGLAIAKGLVEAHAGTIAVANGPHGCRFTITMPRRVREVYNVERERR
jgi:signal transduction histidine kinase